SLSTVPGRRRTGESSHGSILLVPADYQGRAQAQKIEPRMIVEEKILPLEENQRLSRSLLWRLQRNYFEQRGIEAWSSGAVPHHITSSPFIADAYARVVMGFLRDWSTLDHSQPVHIVELGSGSGRFAYSFLKKFLDLQRNSVLKEI